jgi:thioredoxin reductase (NADPH)
VGAGNSAGQAVLHLARHGAAVTMVVRGAGLAASMSEYLVTEIEKNADIRVLLRTEVIDGGGRGHLESLVLRDRDTGLTTTEDAAALFVMIGGEPCTDWLAEQVQRDPAGYLVTGTDVGSGVARGPRWPLERSPAPLETSIPGVFAVGDVRSGSVKRVASAAGEGAVAVEQVHRYLASR